MRHKEHYNNTYLQSITPKRLTEFFRTYTYRIVFTFYKIDYVLCIEKKMDGFK